MKHALAVAVQAGWSAALSHEVQEGHISIEDASAAARFATAIAMELLKGNSVFFKSLDHFAEDGKHWDDLITKHKVNLQKYGD
jgi:hypothetical protein